jgi:hypothetical protein
MLFETLLIFVALGVAVFFVGIPLIKLVKALVPPKKDPLKEAQLRLELAHKEAAAARLNKETEKLYTKMYQEVLEDDTSQEEKEKSRLER